MRVQSECLELNLLRRLAVGDLPTAEVDRLAGHVEQCPACLATLAGLRVADTLADVARSAKDGSSAKEPADTVEFSTWPPPPLAQPVADEPAPTPDDADVLGPYRLLLQLGEGGMGVVYLAEDRSLKRQVALKVLKPALAGRLDARQRFLREAQAMAAIRHDHVVTIYQVGEEHEVPFLAMELLEGETLEARLVREGPLPIADVLRIGRQVAEGLAAAHARGVVHRDVKPANVWLEAGSGRVKLLDFGLARAASDDHSVTQTGVIVGTPSYMAPEQARGEEVDGRADLFSLGVVLYRLCTGRLPFSGTNTTSLLLALTSSEPAPPRQVTPTVPEGLSDLVMRLMAKDPATRPASAAVVARELSALASGGREPPVVASPNNRGLTPPARLAAASLLAAAAVLAGVWVIIRDDKGKEVARVQLPPGGSAEVKADAPAKPIDAPPPNAATFDKAKPFILLRKGKPVAEAQSLAGALALSEPGDVVEVHGNGPFDIGAVALVGKGLHLRAGPGYRPKLVPDAVARKAGSYLFAVEKAQLTIEGCDIDCLQSHTSVILFAGGGGDWRFVNCRLAVADSHNGHLIQYSGPRLVVSDCLLIQHHSHGCIGLGPNVEAEFTNNLIHCGAYVWLTLAAQGGQKLTLRNNSISASIQLGQALDERVVQVPPTVRAEGNVFFGEVLWRVPGKGADAGRTYLAKIGWQGRDNLYVLPKSGVFADCHNVKPDAGFVAAVKTLDDWNKLRGRPEPGSRRIDSPTFAWTDPSRRSWTEAVPAIRDRLAKAGVGPSWPTVGAGDAYTAARLARGDKFVLRPAAHPGGAYVLIRKGEEIAGFTTLSSARDAAESGDVIEVRSDDALGRLHTTAGKSLTLRVAPGYRPVMTEALSLAGNDECSLENLHFRDCQVGNNALAGAFRRVVNCTFEGGAATWLSCAVAAGKTLDVENCALSGAVVVRLGAGAKVRLVDSLLGPVSVDLAGEKPAELSLDGCLVWAPYGSLSVNAAGAGELAAKARRCWFEEPRVVTLSEKVKLAWSGEKNVFATGGASMALRHAANEWPIGLAEWRKYRGSDADSVSAEPLFYDPRMWRLPEEAGADVGRVAATRAPEKR